MTISNGDLRNCIYPEISIDEYQSKTGESEEVIVVAFYAIEEGAANDLDEFIDKSYVEVLDVDVSSNPTTDGKYMIFVEFKREPDFFNKLDKIIKEVENLSGKLNWKSTTRGLNTSVPPLSDTMRDIIEVGEYEAIDITTDDDSDDETSDLADPVVADEPDEMKESLSLLRSDGFIAEDFEGMLVIGGNYFNLLKCGDKKVVSEMTVAKPIICEGTREGARMRGMLYGSWDVTPLQGCLMLEHLRLNKAILLGV